MKTGGILEGLFSGFLPPNISTHGHEIDTIFYIIHAFMLLLFVGWGIFFLFTLFKFRAREGHKATYAPKYTKFSTYLEVGVALFEAALLVVFAIPAWTLAKTAIPESSKRMEVNVIAQQFAWNIHYPGADGIFGKRDIKLVSSDNPIGLDKEDSAAGDDVVSVNELHVPVNQPVLVRLSSLDVIHSFGVNALRVKQDAVPGLVFPVWFEAKETGSHDIACSQLCGLGHYRMRGQVTVESKEAFDSWYQEQLEYSSEESW